MSITPATFRFVAQRLNHSTAAGLRNCDIKLSSEHATTSLVTEKRGVGTTASSEQRLSYILFVVVNGSPLTSIPVCL